MFKELKANQVGFVHLQLIAVAAIIIGGIGAVGSYVVFKSHASAGYSTKWSDCKSNAKLSSVSSVRGATSVSISVTPGSAVQDVTMWWEGFSNNNGSLMPSKTYAHLFPAVSIPTQRIIYVLAVCPNITTNTPTPEPSPAPPIHTSKSGPDLVPTYEIEAINYTQTR